MSLAITYLGHSGFLFDDGAHKLAIDPFLTGNPLAVHTPADISCDVIALTHGHGDHLGDTVELAKQNNATVVATFEVCEYLAEQGVTTCEPGNPGGAVATAFGSVAFTRADHSSSFNGRYMGVCCGLMIGIGGKTIYHAGDTALFSDMKLLGVLYRPDIACIPCGDRFTMGPKHAARAARHPHPLAHVSFARADTRRLPAPGRHRPCDEPRRHVARVTFPMKRRD